MPFFDRKSEITELNQMLTTPRSQFILVYGRRRVGKTTLLLHWARQSNRPYIYWMAKRETPDACRRSLARVIWQWAYPDESDPAPPSFDSWEVLFRETARLIGDRPVILIFDEFPYAVESDSSLPSHLQAAWDHHFKDRAIFLALSGSHIGMMVDLMDHNAPLYGRFTGQLPIGPLPFATLKSYFPDYAAAERVATYAVLGGIPAYLERFDPGKNLTENIRRHLFQRTGMFRSEPSFLVSDLVRETRNYEAILRSVAGGDNTPGDIARRTGLAVNNIPAYLNRLRDLHLIDRHIPATLPLDQRASTTQSHYLVADPFLRFYFRFIEPHMEMVEMGLHDALWERISEQFRAFVGATTFEELCRKWILLQAHHRRLPFHPEIVGSHWARDSQVDVVALNWHKKALLLGECKWGLEGIHRNVVTGLIDKAPLVRPDEDWQIHFAFFSRNGFTEAAMEEGRRVSALMVNLPELDNDLHDAADLGRISQIV